MCVTRLTFEDKIKSYCHQFHSICQKTGAEKRRREGEIEKQRDGGEKWGGGGGGGLVLLVSWNGTNAKLNFSVAGHYSLLHCVTATHHNAVFHGH